MHASSAATPLTSVPFPCYRSATASSSKVNYFLTTLWSDYSTYQCYRSRVFSHRRYRAWFDVGMSYVQLLLWLQNLVTIYRQSQCSKNGCLFCQGLLISLKTSFQLDSFTCGFGFWLPHYAPSSGFIWSWWRQKWSHSHFDALADLLPLFKKMETPLPRAEP